MRGKHGLILSALVLCLACAFPAEAGRESFNWFSLDTPVQGWTILWDKATTEQETVIIRKKDLTAMISVSITRRYGRSALQYAEKERKTANGSAVRPNGSGGYYFHFNLVSDGISREHRLDIWAEGAFIKMFLTFGNDPQLRRIMNSFRYVR